MATSIFFSRAPGSNGRFFEHVIGTHAPVADTIELPVGAVSPGMTHCFVGIQQFESNGTTPDLAGAGTYKISVKFLNSEVWEDLAGTIDGTAPSTMNFAGNVSQVRAVPTGITTAVRYSLHVTANRR